jgi:DNA (cytosine-5)-methyltransferase 1
VRYGSVCSGIEAATVAWHPLGWEAQWFSEIEPFPSAVLDYRFPNVPNLGDMTQIHLNPIFNDSTIDVLVGGTPCQSFSVAGLRKGLDDPRGNLMLTYLSLAERKKPQWIVWENVPGVLSSNGGRDFATFLTALAELGYGFAYRILDAQYFGVAQRRRRVFVVGYLGDWRPAAAVLFESHSLQWNLEKSRKKGKETPRPAQDGIGESGRTIAMAHGQANAEITTNNSCPTLSCVHEAPIVTEPTIIDRAAFNQGVNAQYEPYIEEGETMPSLVAKGPHAVAHAFKIRGGSEVETGEQGGTPGKKAGKGYLGQDERVFTIGAVQDQMIAQPIQICFNDTNGKRKDRPNGGLYITENPTKSPTITQADSDLKVLQPLAVDCYNQTVNEKTSQTIGSSASDVNHYGAVLQPQILAPTITQCKGSRGGCSDEAVSEINAIQQAQNTMAIRRLTPTECERLQGFPDSWTRIPYRNKPIDKCPDGPRYKACGNSMAVPVMHWIGKRIDYIANLLNETK